MVSTPYDFNPRITGGVEVMVNGKVWRASTWFNLRNALVGESNDLRNAAIAVEMKMDREGHPTLQHITRLEPR